MRFDDVVARLAALPDPLPPPSDVLMPVVVAADGGAPPRPPSWPSGDGARRPAGVLVLLYPDDAGLTRVILTERASRDGHHSGEVSFPGGKAEPGDADLEATAVREAEEEVALDVARSDIRIVGRLGSVWIPVSDFEVTPVLAIAAARPRLVPSPDEVARILEPPMSRFLPDAPMDILERTIGSRPLRYGSYDVDGLSVWGATARILSQLGAVLDR